MKSMVEIAKNIVETYQHRSDCVDMVDNAKRILREAAIKSGVNVKKLKYNFTNEAGNVVNVTYKEREAEQKKVAKMHAMPWNKVLNVLTAQGRVSRFSELAGL